MRETGAQSFHIYIISIAATVRVRVVSLPRYDWCRAITLVFITFMPSCVDFYQRQTLYILAVRVMIPAVT